MLTTKFRIRLLHAGAALCALLLALAGTALAAPLNTAAATAGAPAPAPASPTGFSAKGSIDVVERVTLIATVGGQVKDFAWLPGDAVSAEDTAIELIPTQIFAADSGVIRGLQATQGAQAGQVIAEYGALCHIERDTVRQIEAPTNTAYDKAENRDVRVGDVLRVLQGSGDNEVKGTATVVRRTAGGYVVELEQGQFDLEKSAKLYRGTGDDYKDKDKVGRGDVTRPATLPVLGDGCIATVLVEEGQRVERGQPLFTLDAASARHEAAPVESVSFGRPGVLTELLVRPGQFVAQGQALMTLMPTDSVLAVLDVDELDIARVEVGQRIRLKVDAHPDRELSGTVREIVPQGNMVLDTTKFRVKVALDNTDGLMVGMRLTGYWN